MSKKAEKYAKYYAAGWYTAEMLAKLVAKGSITADEYLEITGEEYEEE